MMAPNTIGRPPNPAAMHQLPHAGGPNSATSPVSMKHSPMTGTTRTENAPAVATPAPYSMSHVAGSVWLTPARYSATGRKPPAATGGGELNTKHPAGPDRTGAFGAFGFGARVPTP